MPALVFLTILLLPGLPAAVEPEAPAVRWFDAAGDSAWSRSLEALSEPFGQAADPPLSAPVWLQPVPDLELSLLEGGAVRLSSMRGRVVVFDFWATWCAPCLEELPHLQQMWSELRDRGVDVVAVNAGEPDEQVRSFVDQIGLELPVVRYDAHLDRIFHVGRLPTVVIVDQQGRVRGRWNGYSSGQELAVEARVRDLLDGNSAPVTAEIGSVFLGGDRLEPRWVKKGISDIQGLAASVDGSGAPQLVVARTAEIAVLDATGRQRFTARAPPGTGLLRAGRQPGGKVVGYRVGGSSIVMIDPADGGNTVIQSPAPVMDVAIVDSDQGHQIWLATLAGVLRVTRDAALRPVGGAAEALAIAAGGAGGALVLSTEGVVARLADGGSRHFEPRTLPGAWSLIAAADAGWGALPREVVQAVDGAFLREGRQLAMALPRDRLVVVDLETGALLYAARLPDLGPLAAADLDRDGVDELLAVVGRRLVAWSRPDDP